MEFTEYVVERVAIQLDGRSPEDREEIQRRIQEGSLHEVDGRIYLPAQPEEMARLLMDAATARLG